MSSEIEPFLATEISGDVREVWDRFDSETRFEHALLRGYLDLGQKRSLAILAERLDVPRERLQQLSVKHSWVARAASFDDDHTRRALAELEGEGVEMRERHAAASKALIEKAMAAADAVDPRFIQARDIPTWLDVAAKLERLSRGVQDAPKRVEITGKDGGPIEVANNMSAEERKALMSQIQEQLDKRLGQPAIEGGVIDNIIEGEIVPDDEGPSA